MGASLHDVVLKVRASLIISPQTANRSGQTAHHDRPSCAGLVEVAIGHNISRVKLAAVRPDAGERALADGAQQRINMASIDAALARECANVQRLDFVGQWLAVETLVDTVIARRDQSSWRLDGVIPTKVSGEAFTNSGSRGRPQ
jgi:hypothetical protein